MISNCVLKKNEGIIDAYVKKQDSTSVAGATVYIKKGTQTLGFAPTDSQGKASIAITFTSANEQTFSVTATPPSSLTGAAPATETVNLATEGRQSVYPVFIVAPPDTQAPVIRNLVLRQLDNKKIIAYFTVNEVSQYFAEVIPPNVQQPITFGWAGIPDNGTAANGVLVYNNRQGAAGGTYKVKIKTKDNAGNVSESPMQDFAFVDVAYFNLRAESIAGNSAVLKWNKYPRAEEFAKYVIVKASQPTATTGQVIATITDVNTVSYSLNNLAQNTAHRYVLMTYNSSNNLLGEKAIADFRTSKTMPVIRGFEPNPPKQEVNKNITVAAQISDPDSQVKKSDF